jgi:hypothetical protein
MGLFTLTADADLMNKLRSSIDEIEKKEIKQETKLFEHIFKQRMRTQLIARDAVLVFVDYNATKYQQSILDSANLFDENLDIVINNKDLDSIKKENSEFSKSIEDLESRWTEFYESVKGLSKNSKDKKAFDSIIKNNMELLNDVSYIFAHLMHIHHHTDKLDSSMAHLKSVLYENIGKPRTCITKAVKEKLMVEYNIDREQNIKNLQQTIKDMDRVMRALKDGDKELELTGTENREILSKLANSQDIFENIKSLLNKKSLSKDDIGELIQKNNEFIKVHSEFVSLIRISSGDNY